MSNVLYSGDSVIEFFSLPFLLCWFPCGQGSEPLHCWLCWLFLSAWQCRWPKGRLLTLCLLKSRKHCFRWWVLFTGHQQSLRYAFPGMPLSWDFRHTLEGFFCFFEWVRAPLFGNLCVRLAFLICHMLSVVIYLCFHSLLGMLSWPMEQTLFSQC